MGVPSPGCGPNMDDNQNIPIKSIYIFSILNNILISDIVLFTPVWFGENEKYFIDHK